MAKEDIKEFEFKPGKSGNPKGKPPGTQNSATRFKRILYLIEKAKNPVTGELENFTVLELMDMKIMQKARNGDLQAWNSILDRLEGKAMPADQTPEKFKVEFKVVNVVPPPKKV